MHWDESSKIPHDYVLTSRLIIKYKLKVRDKYCSKSKWGVSAELEGVNNKINEKEVKIIGNKKIFIAYFRM